MTAGTPIEHHVELIMAVEIGDRPRHALVIRPARRVWTRAPPSASRQLSTCASATTHAKVAG